MKIYEARLGKFKSIDKDGYLAHFIYDNEFKTIHAIKVGNRMIDIDNYMRYEIIERDEKNRLTGDVNDYCTDTFYVMGYNEVVPTFKMFINAAKANTKLKPFEKTLKR